MEKISRFFIFIILLNPWKTNFNHINVLWFDYENQYVIRFEPYGSTILHKWGDFDTVFKNYIKLKKSSFSYYSPKDYLGKVGFQIDGDENLSNFVNEPMGNCYVWCFWFIETMLSYQSNQINSIDKIKKIFTVLLNRLLYETTPIYYIRNYASNTQKRLIKFLNKNNINGQYSYKACNILKGEDYNDVICYKLLTFALTKLNKKLD